jgi:hypothetical protein
MKLFGVLVFIFYSIGAHDMSQARFSLLEQESKWELQIEFGDASFLAQYTPECKTIPNPDECFAKHFLKTIEVKFNSQKLSFGKIKMKLGNHVSFAIFEIQDVPKNIKEITLFVNSFNSMNRTHFVSIKGKNFNANGILGKDKHLLSAKYNY